MSVYVELVIFNNLCIDALLVALTLLFRKRKIRKLRFVLAIVVASGIATAYPIVGGGLQMTIKILICPLVALICDKYDNSSARRWLVDYLKSLVIFILITYFLGGVVYGLSFLLGVDICSHATLGLVALALVIAILTVHFLTRSRSMHKRKLCKAQIVCQQKMVELECFCDSGNTLTDDISGAPIVILSAYAERQIVDNSACKIDGFVSVNTVSSECTMPIVRLESVSVDGKEYVAYGALSRRKFDGFDVILQNTMF